MLILTRTRIIDDTGTRLLFWLVESWQLEKGDCSLLAQQLYATYKPYIRALTRSGDENAREGEMASRMKRKLVLEGEWYAACTLFCPPHSSV